MFLLQIGMNLQLILVEVKVPILIKYSSGAQPVCECCSSFGRVILSTSYNSYHGAGFRVAQGSGLKTSPDLSSSI